MHGGQARSALPAAGRSDLTGLTTNQVAEVVIAYEPIWAIGPGEVATAADAQEVCQALRNRLADHHRRPTAETVRILYGGSVKAANVGELTARPDVEGALVGGASLDVDDFTNLCLTAADTAAV